MSLDNRISVVVSTLGRSHELKPLLDSLVDQQVKATEVIIVDQNDDDRISHVICYYLNNLDIRHIQVPNVRGSSNGRNIGWKESTGDILLFADDDCWYPVDFLAKAIHLFRCSKSDVICGRAADLFGRSINGRFLTEKQEVNRSNVWVSQIEWVVLFKRSVLEAVGGYSPHIGIGADSPWQSAEGQDITLYALSSGFNVYFDPNLYGHHAELPVADPNAETCKKAYGYARGMGFVLGSHQYGIVSLLHWVMRPLIGCILYLVRLQMNRSRYYWGITRSRSLGYFEGRSYQK